MNRNRFIPYGIITLLSVFVFILMFFTSSLLWLDVQNSQRSIEVSFLNLTKHYTLESLISQKIAMLELDLDQASSEGYTFDVWLKNFKTFPLEYDLSNQTLQFNHDYENQSVTITLLVSSQEMSVLRILEKNYQNGLDQDYGNSGDPVYGGTP